MIETAQQRYRLRRDTMFSESPQGIYFSNSTSGFEICGANAYRAFRAVYPLLEGEHTEDELREVQQGLRHITDPNEQTAYLRSKVINLLVEEAAGIFLDAEQAILAGTFSGSLIHHLEPRTKAAYEACSQTAYARIYRAREVVDVELAGHRIFTALLDQLLEAQLHPDYQYSRTLLSRVSSQYEMGQPSMYGRIQSTLDYISGMTDIYALDLYRRITGMNLPAV